MEIATKKNNSDIFFAYLQGHASYKCCQGTDQRGNH